MKTRATVFAFALLLSITCLALIFLFTIGHFSSDSFATNNDFRSLAENYYEEFLALNPFYATLNGDNRYNHLLPLDIGEEHRAEQKLGAKFDIREFHDRILINGPVPLEVLENNINRWISSK